MEKVEIFWRDGCGFCSRVQSLFTMKGVKYESYNIWESEEHANLMKTRLPNATTVPQVFIDGKHLGGCDDVMKLEQSGKLDKLLGI
ncbi:MAG: glutaredoxin domain-containing protein [Alphaproteobacteria bacterium]|nr:glutaredoxin domain-containing protein [Alphaproteobacteria bacterium]